MSHILFTVLSHETIAAPNQFQLQENTDVFTTDHHLSCQQYSTSMSNTPLPSPPPSIASVFLLCLLIRLSFALLLRTSFHPDEYFQSVEPAYHLAHSDSSCIPPLTWEWQPPNQLRSHLSIMPCYLLFLLHKHTHSSIPTLPLLLTPRVLQSLLAAISDTCFHHLITDLSGHSLAMYASCLHVGSWSLLFCLPRTLANSTEVVLCIVIAWLWRAAYKQYSAECNYDHVKIVDRSDEKNEEKRGSRGVSLSSRHWEAAASLLSTLAVYARPTSLLLLAPLACLVLYLRLTPPSSRQTSSKYGLKAGSLLVLRCLLVGGVTVAGCICLDVWGYGVLQDRSCVSSLGGGSYQALPVPPLNFVRLNFVENMSARFGVQPWHWHLTQVGGGGGSALLCCVVMCCAVLCCAVMCCALNQCYCFC
jgi:GPI mannosyltransferase 3